MNESERWDYLVRLDEELLLGGVILSEWCTLITREADTAFARGAHLASIVLAMSAVETHLRSEHSPARGMRLVDLIVSSDLPKDLKADLHTLRKYRNKWVHVDEPWEDEALLADPAAADQELEEMAVFATRILRRAIYANPWV
jgi:hypothetical protein